MIFLYKPFGNGGLFYVRGHGAFQGGDNLAAPPNKFSNSNGASRRNTFGARECFAASPILYGKDKRGGKLKTIKKLLDSMNFLPDGARVGVYWLEAGGSQGHIIAAEKVHGEMVFIDPQNGVVGSGAIAKADRNTGYFWFREDELELDNSFEWEEIVREVKK